MTLRALDVFRQVDVVAAEDTRITARLLNHYGIAAKKLIALHEHNERQSAPRVVGLLESGASVALVTDAGTPGISDPGARLVAAVREAGFRVVPIPGANAAAAAVSASGLAGAHFLFYGFLPAKGPERRKALEVLSPFPHALVFYEAPHRVLAAAADLAEILGGSRRIVIARELTKLFESIHVCELSAAAHWLGEDPDRIKGEFVLIVEGAAPSPAAALAEAKRALGILLEELPVKQAAALAARITGARKNDLYDLALEMRKNAERLRER